MFPLKPYPPLGLLYIASNMIKNGLDVDVLDLATCFPSKIEEVVGKKVRNYDFIGISCTTISYPIALKVAKMCRERNPKSKIVFGGPHASFFYDNILKYPFVDYVIVGEGEISFTDLILGKKLSGVPGLVYRKNNKIFSNPRRPINDLDSLPFPLRYKTKPIHFQYGQVFPVLTSRGCPVKCSYCAESRLFPVLRFRSAKNVVDEIQFLNSSNNDKIVDFVDSNFTISNYHVKSICKELLRRKINVEFMCQGHLDSTSISLLNEMKKAGLTFIMFGLESLSNSILTDIHKTSNPQLYKKRCFKVLTHCKKIGIKVQINYILGFLGQTKECVKKDFTILRNYGDIALFNLTPYPGTPLWKKFKNEVTLDDFYKFDGFHQIFNNSNMSENDMIELQFLARPLKRRVSSFLNELKPIIKLD